MGALAVSMIIGGISFLISGLIFLLPGDRRLSEEKNYSSKSQKEIKAHLEVMRRASRRPLRRKGG
jgi:hypothetical protein